MHDITVNEFPFVTELPKREKSRLGKLWDQFQEMSRVTEEKGILLPVGIIAELLDVSRQRVHQLMEAGRLEGIQFNGRWFITGNSLEAWAEAEHKAGRPPLAGMSKDSGMREMVAMTKRYMAAERVERSSKQK